MNNLIIIFIDSFQPKNQLQFESIGKLQFKSHWFVTDKNNSNFTQCEILNKNLFSRITQIINYIIKERTNIHHVEIYPGGRLSFIYSFICLFFNLKILCAERGDILYFKKKNKGGYNILFRISMFITYRTAKMIWYREPYMEEKLKKITKKKLFFLHNCVRVHPSQSNSKKYDFLWVNRVITDRRADWLIDILRNKEFTESKNIIIGLLKNDSQDSKQEEYLIKNKPNNIEFHNYINPVEFYSQSKFFVLPSTIVFANNALLEAMSYGVVPLISNTQSSYLIVQNGINGFIFDHNKHSFLETMLKAKNLSDFEYSALSNNAIQTTKEHFSEEYYLESLNKMYSLI